MSGSTASSPWYGFPFAGTARSSRSNCPGTSGNAAYDRLVLGKARSLGTLPSGPAPLARETLWAFETDFTQIPPLPLAGCALDDFIPKNCWHPLQKLQHSRVRLLAIY